MKITEQQYAEAEANGISKKLLQNRVNTRGWKLKRAITTPVRQSMRRSAHDNRTPKKHNSKT